MKHLIKSILFALLLFATTNFLIQNLFSKSIEQAEQKLLLSGENVIKSSINSYTNTLSVTTKDWASWDDTYYFISNLNKNYIDSNITDETLINTKINIFAFFNTKGDLVYKKTLNYKYLDDQIAIPAEAYKNNKDNNIFQQVQKTINSKIGVSQMIHTDKGLLVYSIYPILPSNEQGDPKGALLLGKYFGEEQEDEIKKTTSLNFKTSVFSNVEPELQNKLTKTNGFATFYNDKMEKYFLIKDSFNNPALSVIFTYPRIIKAWFTGEVSLYLSLFVGIAGGSLYFLFEKLKYIYFEFIKK